MSARLLSVLASVAVSVLSVTAAAPVEVDVDYGGGTDRCPIGRFCLYQDRLYNGSGTGFVLTSDQSIPRLSTYGSNDQVSSVYNNTSRALTLYKSNDYRGEEMTIDADQKLAYLPAGWNDAISSVKIR
ncbi:peptidase inhibitor family I36 protein [Streptomyces sp. NPDC055107]